MRAHAYYCMVRAFRFSGQFLLLTFSGFISEHPLYMAMSRFLFHCTLLCLCNLPPTKSTRMNHFIPYPRFSGGWSNFFTSLNHFKKSCRNLCSLWLQLKCMPNPRHCHHLASGRLGLTWNDNNMIEWLWKESAFIWEKSHIILQLCQMKMYSNEEGRGAVQQLRTS